MTGVVASLTNTRPVEGRPENRRENRRVPVPIVGAGPGARARRSGESAVPARSRATRPIASGAPERIRSGAPRQWMFWGSGHQRPGPDLLADSGEELGHGHDL